MTDRRVRAGAVGALSRKAAAALLAGIGLALPVTAQDGGGLGGPGQVQLPSAADTLRLDAVDLRATGSSGDPARDAQILGAARARLGLTVGDRLSPSVLETARLRLSRVDGVRDVRARLSPSGDAGGTRVTFELDLAETASAARPTGMLVGEGLAAFPHLWRSERGALRFILAGGNGIFSDGNPWFGNAAAFTAGNPLVEDPAVGANTGRRATWTEAWVEFGLGGVTQLGESNFALYGAATGIAVASRGQDIFRGDARQTLNLEKAYLGLLWGSEDGSRSVNLSFGRQNFSLNDGFLISQFGSQWNAGPRPGVYLAPRTTHDLAVLGTVKIDGWTGTAFYLDPNEYEPLESDTQLAGANLRYSFTDRFHVDATVIRAVASNTRYAAPSGPVGTREGLVTYAVHLRWADPALAPGLWLEAEFAHQRHSDFDMRASAGYATAGYLARDLPWSPSISYRYSGFTGDDPDTDRYERFDALYSGGLSEWLQGISLGKVLRPENRLSHRVRLNLAPTERLNLTLDWFLHRAHQLNNLGANPAIATLTSRDLGQEVQLAARWAVSDRLYAVGIVSIAFPGDAIRSAAGGTAEPWTTLQAQLFWTF